MTPGAMTSWACLIAAGVLSSGCAATGPREDVPPWVTELIRQLEAEPVANPPAYVARYDYKGVQVYYVPPRCCDVPGTLYDEAGEVLCGPDGGLSGRGDGRCPDFFTARRNEQIIWRDRRSAASLTSEDPIPVAAADVHWRV